MGEGECFWFLFSGSSPNDHGPVVCCGAISGTHPESPDCGIPCLFPQHTEKVLSLCVMISHCPGQKTRQKNGLNLKGLPQMVEHGTLQFKQPASLRHWAAWHPGLVDSVVEIRILYSESFHKSQNMTIRHVWGLPSHTRTHWPSSGWDKERLWYGLGSLEKITSLFKESSRKKLSLLPQHISVSGCDRGPNFAALKGLMWA